MKRVADGLDVDFFLTYILIIWFADSINCTFMVGAPFCKYTSTKKLNPNLWTFNWNCSRKQALVKFAQSASSSTL
jgi:hypothetical protein